jgi:HEAT repeat protein
MTDEQDGIDALIAAIDQLDKPKIRAAVDALIPLAAQSRELRAKLDGLLNQVQADRRWPIAYILGQLPEPSGAAIGNLLDGLDHREPDIRWALALLLIRIAKNHPALIPLLIELCAGGTVNQKRMAIYCLRDLQLTDEPSLQTLLRALHDADTTVRVAAVTSLGLRGEVSGSGRQELLQVFLRDSELPVRNAAAITLAKLGAPSPALMEALQEAAAGDNAQLKKAALAALAILQSDRSAGELPGA